MDSSELWMMVYGLASLIYRYIILGAIVWMILAISKENGYKAIGQMVALVVVAGVVFPMLFKFQRAVQRSRAKLNSPLRSEAIDAQISAQGDLGSGGTALNHAQKIRYRKTFLILVLLATLLAFVFVPVPHSAYLNGTIQSKAEITIYAPADGKLISVNDESNLLAGDRIVQMKNVELESAMVEYENEIAQTEIEIRDLRLQINRVPELAARIAVLKSKLADIQQQLSVAQQEMEKLDVRAPIEGQVFRLQKLESSRDQSRLETWIDNPFKRENSECYLKRGEQICVVADPSQPIVTLLVQEHLVDQLQIGNEASIRPFSNPYQTFTGRVVEISRERVEVDSVSSPLAQEQSSQFQIQIELDDPPSDLKLFGSVSVKVSLGKKTLFERVRRILKTTFTVDF